MNSYAQYVRAKTGAANLVRAQHQLAAAAAVHGAVVRDIYRMAFKTPKIETVNSLAAKHGLPKSRVKSLLSELQDACATARTERIGKHPVGRLQPEGRIYRLPTGTPATRLVKHRAVIVERLFRSQYRTSTNESQVRVRVGMDVAATYEADSCFPYRGAYKTYRATASIHTLTVGRRWLTRVHKTGLAVVEGHLVLDAERFWSPASPAGVSLYDVAYVLQGRGFEVRLERGVVAVAAKKRVLADSIQNAIRAIDRKLAA